MAALLEKLVAGAKVHSTLRYEAIGAELFVVNPRTSPGALETRLARIRMRFNGTPANGEPDAPTAACTADIWNRLVRLGEMLDRGQLSPGEFASAKASLLEQPD